jgi:hypothetical protein
MINLLTTDFFPQIRKHQACISDVSGFEHRENEGEYNDAFEIEFHQDYELFQCQFIFGHHFDQCQCFPS